METKVESNDPVKILDGKSRDELIDALKGASSVAKNSGGWVFVSIYTAGADTAFTAEELDVRPGKDYDVIELRGDRTPAVSPFIVSLRVSDIVYTRLSQEKSDSSDRQSAHISFGLKGWNDVA